MRISLSDLPSITLLSLVLVILSQIAPLSPFSLLLLIIQVYIMGDRLTDLLFCETKVINRTGLALISGFSLLSLTLLIPYGFLFNVPFGLKGYILAIFVLTNLAFDVMSYSRNKKEKVRLTTFMKDIAQRYSDKNTRLVLMIFVASLFIGLAYSQQNQTSILPDGALYYSLGRTLSESGNFSVNLLNDVPVHSPLQLTYGLVPRTITWFVLGFFFSFGGVSFECAKFVLVFFGSLLVFPVCDLARMWFKKKFWIAGVLIAVHPIISLFSILLFGPELLSSVFAISGIVLLEYCKKTTKISYKTIALSAFLLGTSMLVWEDKFIVLYLIAYSLSCMTLPGFPKRKQVIVVPLLLGLYLTLVLSTTWWNLFHPFYYFTILIPLAIIFRKDRWISIFILISAIITALFNIWLNRFYLYPELVINPTIQSIVRRPLSSYILPNFINGNILNFVSLYQSILILSTLLSVLILGLLSLVLFSRKILAKASYPYFFIMLHAVSLIFFVQEEAGFFQRYAASRFFIGSVTFLIILASATIAFLLNQFRRFGYKGSTESYKKKTSSSIIMLFLLAVAFAPIANDFYRNGYLKNAEYLSQANYPQNLGILESLSWIQNNTSQDETFLVASWGTTRVWSMQIGDRTFASLNIVKNGKVLSPEETSMNDVFTLAKELNATYMIFDRMIIDYGYTKLRPYYDEITPKDMGKTRLSLPEETNLNELLSHQSVDTIEVTFVSTYPNKVVIFKPGERNFTSLWHNEFTSQGWEVFLNGTIAIENGTMQLTTPPFCNSKVYTRYTFDRQISFSENTFMILKAEQAPNSTIGFFIRFTDSTETIQTFANPGIYAVPLGDFSGKTPHTLLAYNILEPQVRNTDSAYTVSYDFFALIDITDFP